MKTLILYALEVLACSGVLLGAYAILLERRVSFRWCRVYLLVTTLLAGIIPLLRIPVWQGEVIEAVPMVSVDGAWSAEVVEEAAPIITPEAVCLVIYLLGVGLIAGVMLWQVIRIRQLRKGAAISRTDRFSLVRTPQRIASFSFFRSVYVWDQTPTDELQAILAHEASHITHRHSIERICMECLKAAMWWNPFVWIAARRLTEAEEFEADSDVLTGGYNIEHYMNAIFKQLFGYSPEIANGLRDSLTKKRFKMMTTKMSGRHALLRLAGTIPAVIGLVCAFSLTTRAAEIRIPDAEETTTDQVAAPTDESNKNVQITVSKDGEPLPGAIIIVTGTTRGVVTDQQGNASIDVQPNATLDISYVGCATRQVPIRPEEGVSERIYVTMEPNTELEKIVVTAQSEKISDQKQSDKQQPATTPKAPKAPVKGEFIIAEQMPKFRGGDLNTFRTWVQERINYPAEAVKQKIEGRVVVSFVIETDGTVGDFKTLETPDKLLSEEVRRVIESSSSADWTPGQQRQKNVRVKYTLPIDFKLPFPQASTTTVATVSDNEPFLVVEQMPKFQNGDFNSFRNWVMQQIRYPEKAMKQNIQGRVVATFIIEKDGSVGDIKIIQSPDKLLSDEAFRVINSTPAGAWTPGKQRGKNVRVQYAIPVDFHIQGSDNVVASSQSDKAIRVVSYGPQTK